jgi:hypothetical protein
MSTGSETSFSKDDSDSLRTPNASQAVREQLDNDVEAFLAAGGSVQEIEVNVMADPPTKPVSKYGGRPI